MTNGNIWELFPLNVFPVPVDFSGLHLDRFQNFPGFLFRPPNRRDESISNRELGFRKARGVPILAPPWGRRTHTS